MNVCVYCASSNEVSPFFANQAKILGTWLAENNHTLVYGGATGGLMEAVAQAARDANGYIVGIVPQRVIDKGRKADIADELLCVETLSERKELLKAYADVCVVLPGGFGTFDELFDTVSSTMLGESDLPTIVVNEDGYYDGLLIQFKRMVTERLGYAHSSDLQVCNSTAECINLLEKKALAE